MPQEAYTGLHYGTTKNKFAELQAVLKSMLDAVVSKAIQQFPEHRYQDVSDIKTAIESIRTTPVPQVSQQLAATSSLAPSPLERSL